MGFNKKVLSKAVSELGKAKAPAKPRDIITDPAGQWKYPGQKTRIPGSSITMQGVDYPVWAQPNVGPGSMMQPNQDYNFPDADYVDETPMVRKGGTLKSKRYSSNISATNKLFIKNKLFQSKKHKIFDPNAKFKSGGSKLGPINLNPNPLSHYELNYGFNLPTKQDGGENEDEYMDLTDEEIQAYKEAGYEVDEEPEYEIGGYVQHELVKAQKGREILPPTAADSSAILKNALAIEKYYKKYTKHLAGETKSPPDVFKILDDQNKQKKKQQMFGITTLTPQGERLLSNTEYHKNVDNNKFYQRESANDTIDTHAPMTLYDRRIKPQTTTYLQNNNKTDKLMGDVAVLEKYDPLAITPVSQLSDAQVKIRYKKYGLSGLPSSRLQELGLVKTKIKPITIEESDKINTLPLRPIQQFISPEQTIIPGKPYVKPKPNVGPRYGSLAGDENLDLPAGYTQQEREAARRKRDAEVFQRKNLEYQQQQRGNEPVAKVQKGGTKNYKILPETFNYEGRPGARYRKDNSGNWLVADKSTDGKFVAVKDSTGKRQAELNKKAISSETGKNVYVPKNAQKRFEQELWNDYDKLSMPEKALDRVQAGMTDPLGMTSRFLTGKQAYIPGMGKGLLNTDSENYEKYLKSVGYTPGKFEASDVQNLLNPMNWSASAGNQLAKGNVGQGLLETGLALAGTGQSKNIMKGAKYLMDDITKGSKTLKNVSLPKYKNVYRVEPTSFTKDPKDAMSGRWIGTQEEMPFYIRNLKDPEAGIRIMRQKMPVKKWEALSGHNMPEEAKLMSAGTGDYKTFNDAINAGELSSGAGKRLSKNVPLTSDMQELSNNPRLINLQEGIISDELANKLRYEKPRKYFSNRDLVEYPSGDLGKKGAIDHIFTVNKDVEKPILGIPRQYLPFKDGGVTEAWEDELDEDEIEELRRGGYVVEDLD